MYKDPRDLEYRKHGNLETRNLENRSLGTLDTYDPGILEIRSLEP